MSEFFHVSIATPERVVYHGDAGSLMVPAKYGYLQVLAHHAALIASLIPGEITVQDNTGQNKTFSLKGSGFLQVSHNTAKVLLDNL
ncbi:MAG: F0F1 ATP synthase subunit epsilon [Candidatus Omnitrophica bacterium]|nr:F0F1 ATP synthase subunit epsilon [Candidatus Omnitrophota bacterium]